ncbi:MAG TPA: hypothetical protein PKC63_05260, partial [Mariniflexile sp.]|nr:hypothetical protein [Mariniflexile sp.]
MKTQLHHNILIYAMLMVFSESIVAQCWQSVQTGGNHALAFKTDGTLWGWGENSAGMLGDGSNIDKTEPELISTALDWAYLSVGNEY